MKASFQKNFQIQPNLKNTKNDIELFLNSDNDTQPLTELNRQKITPEQAQPMEGLLTLDELTDSLFNHIKVIVVQVLMVLLSITYAYSCLTFSTFQEMHLTAVLVESSQPPLKKLL